MQEAQAERLPGCLGAGMAHGKCQPAWGLGPA